MPDPRAKIAFLGVGDCLRVLVFTCRFTTFLQYCALDFARAFGLMGCKVRHLIEENDVEYLSEQLYWKELDEFRPDLMFGISHGRPSMPYIPRELPFVCYVQDKCGPLLVHNDLSNHIEPHDVFVCMCDEFKKWLVGKGVPERQCMILPIPADERMFYPLKKEDPRARKYTVDISFVNHGNVEHEKLFKKFLQDNFGRESDDVLKNKLISIFTELYKNVCFDCDTCRYEDEMQDFVLGHLSNKVSDEVRHGLGRLVTTFYITVYAAAFRSQFVEALDQALLKGVSHET